jgi:hypothetical protein
VLVEVDEAGRDGEAPGVDLRPPAKRPGGDRLDLAAGEADVADGVEAAFRVEDAAAAQDEVERPLVGRRDAPRQRQEQDGTC